MSFFGSTQTRMNAGEGVGRGHVRNTWTTWERPWSLALARVILDPANLNVPADDTDHADTWSKMTQSPIYVLV